MEITIILMNAIYIHYLCQNVKRILKSIRLFTVNFIYRSSCYCCLCFFNLCFSRQILLSFKLIGLKFSTKMQIKQEKYFRALWSLTGCTQSEAQIILRFLYGMCYFVKSVVQEEESIVWLYCVDINMDKFRQNTEFGREINPKIKLVWYTCYHICM